MYTVNGREKKNPSLSNFISLLHFLCPLLKYTQIASEMLKNDQLFSAKLAVLSCDTKIKYSYGYPRTTPIFCVLRIWVLSDNYIISQTVLEDTLMYSLGYPQTTP